MPVRSRRQFLEPGAATASALNLETAVNGASTFQRPFSAEIPHVGLIGTGGRGTSVLRDFLTADVRVAACFDLVPEKVAGAKCLLGKASRSFPGVHIKDEHAFEKLLELDDLDALNRALHTKLDGLVVFPRLDNDPPTLCYRAELSASNVQHDVSRRWKERKRCAI
jgi:hypothetical protein